MSKVTEKSMLSEVERLGRLLCFSKSDDAEEIIISSMRQELLSLDNFRVWQAEHKASKKAEKEAANNRRFLETPGEKLTFGDKDQIEQYRKK